MPRRKFGAALLAISVAMGATFGGLASAQQVEERVVAVVNDHPISSFDVSQRIRLMIATQGAQVSEEALPQFQQQALQDLVEERLKLQEAERFDLNIPDDQIDQELARIAASGGGGIDALAQDLGAQGIALNTLRDKIRAEQAWEQLVRGRFGSRINVTGDDIEAQLDVMRADIQQEQYLISEICLRVDDPSQAEQVYGIGLQMIEQMRRGVPFQALAQQFSACPTAARGGDLGWLRSTDLDPVLGEVLPRLGVGNISRPIPHEDMLKMLAVRQKRDAAEPGEPSYEIAYAGALPTLDAETARERLERLAETNPCNGRALSTDLGEGIGVTVLPMVPERQFTLAFRPVLADLEIGESSPVVEVGGTLHAMMLCDKDEGLGLPSRRIVESRLESEQLELLSRRYLRDVERDSAVEFRLASDG